MNHPIDFSSKASALAQKTKRGPRRGFTSDRDAEFVYRALLNVVAEIDDATRIDLISALVHVAPWEELPLTVKVFSRQLCKALEE